HAALPIFPHHVEPASAPGARHLHIKLGYSPLLMPCHLHSRAHGEIGQPEGLFPVSRPDALLGPEPRDDAHLLSGDEDVSVHGLLPMTILAKHAEIRAPVIVLDAVHVVDMQQLRMVSKTNRAALAR